MHNVVHETKDPQPFNDRAQKDQETGSTLVVDAAAERAYVKRMDMYLLPFLSIMYFFNAVDRQPWKRRD
ncbi:hypothetical protein LRP88_11156 [Fusarium phalaenopsidis]